MGYTFCGHKHLMIQWFNFFFFTHTFLPQMWCFLFPTPLHHSSLSLLLRLLLTAFLCCFLSSGTFSYSLVCLSITSGPSNKMLKCQGLLFRVPASQPCHLLRDSIPPPPSFPFLLQQSIIIPWSLSRLTPRWTLLGAYPLKEYVLVHEWCCFGCVRIGTQQMSFLLVYRI